MKLTGNEPAMPLQPTFNSEGQICETRYDYDGLTIRQHFAAMAKVPNQLIEQEINAWRALNGLLPAPFEKDFGTMIETIAVISARYKAIEADALIAELNKI